MNHPWQQPIRPLEYFILSAGPTIDGEPVWYNVMFIRPTDNGFEIIGENGARWNVEDILIKEAAR